MSTRQNINIAILGTVSAGKSTLLNNIYTAQYSDMKIKRTTMQPQVYLETDELTVSKSDIEQIKSMNEQLNKQLIDKTEKNEQITIDDIKETNYYVPKVHKLVNLVENVYLSVYDIPGLNDFRTKNVYFEYINRNFYKFDIIIYVIDVNSAMNTSDEKDIIEMILNNIKKNKEEYNIENKLMVLVNKCDDMFTRDGKIIMDEEYTEMLTQVKTTVEQKVKEIYPNTVYNILPISAEDSYIYRMYDRNPDADLDIKHMNKFGLNEFGKRIWNQMTDDDKKEKIKNIMESLDLDNILIMTGFNEFKQQLQLYLSKENQKKYLVNHLNYMIKNIEMPKSLIHNTQPVKNIYDSDVFINSLFGDNQLSTEVFDFLQKYWTVYSDLLRKSFGQIADAQYENSLKIMDFLNTVIKDFPLLNILVEIRKYLNKAIEKYYIENINRNNKPFSKLYTFITNLISSMFSKNTVTSEKVYKMFTNKDILQMSDDEIIIISVSYIKTLVFILF
jgi:predicted GTPase